jgi:predicted oxidoreductase
MSQKGKVVKITYSEENSSETDLWMYRVMEKIILDQLDIHPIIKAELLRTNQSRIKKIISGGDYNE